MKSRYFCSLLAFVGSVVAQTPDFDAMFTPTSWQEVNTGNVLTITWNAPAKYSGQKIDISLIGGASQATQIPIMKIVSGIDNDAESYNWKVDASLGADNVYGLVIALSSDPNIFQYSNPFKIKAQPQFVTSKPDATTKPDATSTAHNTVSSLTSFTTVAPSPTKTHPVDIYSVPSLTSLSTPGTTATSLYFNHNDCFNVSHSTTTGPRFYATLTPPVIVNSSGPRHAIMHWLLVGGFLFVSVFV